MIDAIGPDGLTDEERADLTNYARVMEQEDPPPIEECGDAFRFLNTLAAERLAHAETRAGLERQLVAITGRLFDVTATLTAQAKKAEAERDRLRAVLPRVALRSEDDGPCFCVVRIVPGTAHHLSCVEARALLGAGRRVGHDGLLGQNPADLLVL